VVLNSLRVGPVRLPIGPLKQSTDPSYCLDSPPDKIDTVPRRFKPFPPFVSLLFFRCLLLIISFAFGVPFFFTVFLFGLNT